MTATDMHMMRRLGAPSVSPDGRYAVFALSTTDLAANKRNNVVHILDLKAKGAAPQPIAGMTQGAHDAVFGADGAIWYLAPVGGQDQLFRMTVGGQPAQVSGLKGDISGFKVSADGSRLLVWADRDLQLRRFRLRRPAQGAKRRVGPGLRPDVRPPLGHLGRAGRPQPHLRLPDRRRQGDRRRRAGDWRAGRRHAVQAVRRRRGDRHLGRRPDRLFRACARPAGSRPNSTNLDIFAAPADGSAQPTNLTADNDGTDNLPALSPDGRTLAYFSMARADL